MRGIKTVKVCQENEHIYESAIGFIQINRDRDGAEFLQLLDDGLPKKRSDL